MLLSDKPCLNIRPPPLYETASFWRWTTTYLALYIPRSLGCCLERNSSNKQSKELSRGPQEYVTRQWWTSVKNCPLNHHQIDWWQSSSKMCYLSLQKRRSQERLDKALAEPLSSLLLFFSWIYPNSWEHHCNDELRHQNERNFREKVVVGEVNLSSKCFCSYSKRLARPKHPISIRKYWPIILWRCCCIWQHKSRCSIGPEQSAPLRISISFLQELPYLPFV
jgi:hypothetical protein